MEEKKPIDRKRESSGQAEIGKEEEGAIIKMVNIGDRLLVIKERAIYDMIFADNVDPKRTNIDLPNTIQKLIISKGAESETVSRTLITSLTLFKTDYIDNRVDCDKINGLAIDLLSEISELEDEIKKYRKAENESIEEYEKRKQQKKSFKVPSIENLQSKCKTIFQKADHVKQTLMDIITTIYPELGINKQSHYPNLYDKLKIKFGETDPFVKFTKKAIDFMQIIRELRNGFDHRLEHTKAIDFELKTDGGIIAPTIELNHKKIRLKRTSLIDFLDITHKNLIEIIESTTAFLASKNIRTSGLPNQVRVVPIEKRRNKLVKYGFWAPIGKEGFYSQ